MAVIKQRNVKRNKGNMIEKIVAVPSYWYTQFSDVDTAFVKQKIDDFVAHYGVDYMLYFKSDFKSGTLLYLAAENASLEIIRYLIEEKNANINIPGESDFTPLMTAIQGKKFINAGYLLSKGADIQQHSALGLLFNVKYECEARRDLMKNLILRGDTIKMSRYKLFPEFIKEVETLQKELLAENPSLVLKDNRLVNNKPHADASVIANAVNHLLKEPVLQDIMNDDLGHSLDAVNLTFAANIHWVPVVISKDERKSNEQGFFASSVSIVSVPTGLVHQPVPGDGNCLFSAVAKHFESIDQKTLRVITATYMDKNKEKYSGFIEGGIERHIHDLIFTNAWAQHVDIDALSEALETRIVIMHGMCVQFESVFPLQKDAYKNSCLFIEDGNNTAFYYVGFDGEEQVIQLDSFPEFKRKLAKLVKQSPDTLKTCHITALQLKMLIQSCGGSAPYQEMMDCLNDDIYQDKAPIFVYYNGHNHYDTLLLNGTQSAQDILTACKIAVDDYVAVNVSMDSEDEFVQDNELDGWTMM